MTSPRILVVIPARGGSKGIPRKNLRRLAGQPLIAHAVATATASSFDPLVVVTSDDDEILSVGTSLGVATLRREPSLSDDDTTLDSVVHDAWRRMSASDGAFDIVVTVQPTSPLLRTETLDRAIARLVDDDALDTVLAATDDTHLRWGQEGDGFVPLYAARVNRQQLPPTYRETGAFLVTRARNVTGTSRIGPAVALQLLEGAEAIDIDTIQDFMQAEWQLTMRRVVFVVAGYPDIGLGHVHNALTLAAELVRHDVRFVVPHGHDLAASVIEASHYPVVRHTGGDLVTAVADEGPDVVINDLLDTEASYVSRLKQLGCTVINFEDLGPGARHADLVINAIYPERQFLPNHFFGHRYFVARNEFLVGGVPLLRPDVERVLVTFGGTDPGNLTQRVLDAMGPYANARGIAIDVVLGPGYTHPRPQVKGATVVDSVGNISDYMRRADVAFTSAGRTVFELACVGTPAIILAQNDREMTHLFASEANGFLHLGLGHSVSEAEIRQAFADLVDDPRSRATMRALMLDHDVGGGRERVVKLVEDAIMGR